MAQTSYDFYSGVGYEGQISDLSNKTVDSYIAEGNIPFGRGLVQGATDREAKLAVSGGTFLGVAVRSHDYANDQAEDIVEGQSVNVLTAGRVYMKATGTIAKNADVYVIVAVGATQGQATATSGGNLLAGKALNSVTTGQLVEVQVNNK